MLRPIFELKQSNRCGSVGKTVLVLPSLTDLQRCSSGSPRDYCRTCEGRESGPRAGLTAAAAHDLRRTVPRLAVGWDLLGSRGMLVLGMGPHAIASKRLWSSGVPPSLRAKSMDHPPLSLGKSWMHQQSAPGRGRVHRGRPTFIRAKRPGTQEPIRAHVSTLGERLRPVVTVVR